jgi:hypothetical protein
LSSFQRLTSSNPFSFIAAAPMGKFIHIVALAMSELIHSFSKELTAPPGALTAHGKRSNNQCGFFVQRIRASGSFHLLIPQIVG